MKKALIIIIIILGVFQLFKYIKNEASYDDSDYEVILFTAQNCPPCRDAEKFLDDNEVEYTIYYIDESDENMKKFKEYNGTKFPLVIIGDQRIEGYNENLLTIAINSLYEPGEGATKVVVYTSNGCGWCTKAMNYLKKNNIEYDERNISEDTDYRQEFQELGGRGTPLILVGDNKIYGFNEKAIKMALKQVGLM